MHPDNLPTWADASEVYKKAQQINLNRANEAYKYFNDNWPGDKTGKFRLPESTIRCIDAMNKGDEAFLKAYITVYDIYIK
jgi:hypothetical protein